MDILYGILMLLFGLAIATLGMRVWFWMLPILGFMAGFSLGTVAIYQLAGDGILETVLSWIVGLVAGIFLALISWLWWYFGVIIAAGSVGAALATGIATSFGAERDWVLILAGIIGAALFAFAALVFNLPVYMIIFTTAVGGALGAVTGLLLIFNRLDMENLGGGQSVAIVRDSLGWWLLWAVIAAGGIVVQLRTTAAIALPVERYIRTSDAVRPDVPPQTA